jgi:GH35 family endo-1,4-beta-xylanase
MTPENRFKWPLYERAAGSYQEAAAALEQEYVAFAQAAGYDLVRGHTLEWGKVGKFW